MTPTQKKAGKPSKPWPEAGGGPLLCHSGFGSATGAPAGWELPRPLQVPHHTAICFIINHCLANKGRVQFKNTRNSKAGGISRTMMGPQPLAMTINILLAARLTATTLPAPLLVTERQAFSPQEVQHHVPGTAKWWKVHVNLHTAWRTLFLTPLSSILGLDPQRSKKRGLQTWKS